jgi:hypothetical protein
MRPAARRGANPSEMRGAASGLQRGGSGPPLFADEGREREDDAAEEVVLRLLVGRELLEGDERGVRLGVGVLDLDLLVHPRVVARAGGRCGVIEVEADAVEGARTLPLGRFFPGGLRGVARGGAEGTIRFVADARDLFDGHRFTIGSAAEEADGSRKCSRPADRIEVDIMRNPPAFGYCAQKVKRSCSSTRRLPAD